MIFSSILFDPPLARPMHVSDPADFFTDLHLDQIVDAITADFTEYDLKTFFYTPLKRIDSIQYRQEVMRDLEDGALLAHIEDFAKSMRRMREYMARSESIDYAYQVQRYFLDAVHVYCDSVENLSKNLLEADLRARGLLLLRDYLRAYTESVDFRLLVAETRKLEALIVGITYTLEITGLKITVSRYNAEPDYGAEVLHTFDKFRQGGAAEYTFTWPGGVRMSHVEEAILERVARLYPYVFASLKDYCERHQTFLDETLRTFDREIHFYVACVRHMGIFKSAGLSVCYPMMSEVSKETYGCDVFDAALATRIAKDKRKGIVCNDFELKGEERILVITGANQGGKTTFARAFGQLHYLSLLGCPVAAKVARVHLFDRLFTHFEREEDLQTLAGKLELDLRRIHRILQEATGRSILIMNECFSSTTIADALFLSREVLTQIIRRDMICVTVTFFDELASFAPKIVSMVAAVDEGNQTERTFKIVRKTADGRAYAASIARKYRLTGEDLRRRLSP
jgi:DNA mismatch repair protein MutS